MNKLFIRGLLISGLLFGFCSSVVAMNTDAIAYSGIVDFGEHNVNHLKQRLLSFNDASVDKTNYVVSILQFGDSHTAADFFSGELRRQLQAKYGDAGIGWVTPMRVAGQHHTAIKWQSENWELVSSRTANDRDFPMGGYIASPTKNSGYIRYIPDTISNNWLVTLVFKPLIKKITLTLSDAKNKNVPLNFTPNVKQWQSTSATLSAPFKLMANKGEIELGGVWLQKANTSGIILSAIAMNGAKQSLWQKWSPSWFQELAQSKSDLVILAYGTNETFEATLNLKDYQQNLIENIRHIRKQLPNAVILLISPPDTMLSNPTDPNCFSRQPPNYAKVRAIQQVVARQEKTLYWDWQTAMGGDCIIEKWLLLDLARPDLIHLSQQGYIESAGFLSHDFFEFFSRK